MPAVQNVGNKKIRPTNRARWKSSGGTVSSKIKNTVKMVGDKIKTDPVAKQAAKERKEKESLAHSQNKLGKGIGYEDIDFSEEEQSLLEMVDGFILEGSIEQMDNASFLADAVDNLSSNISSAPGAVANWAAAFQGSFTVIAKGWTAVSSIVQKDFGTEDLNKKELVAKVSDEGLSTIEGIMKTLSSAFELANKMPKGFGNVVPAIGVAISALNFIKEAYYIYVSRKSMALMNKEMQRMLPGIDKKEIDKDVKHYREKYAQISNINSVIASYESEIESLPVGDKRLGTMPSGSALSQKEYDQSHKIKTAFFKTIGNYDDKNVERYFQREKQEAKVEVLRSRAQDIEANISNGTKYSEADIAEYALASELWYINAKRVRRQAVLLTVESVNMAAQIATLASGGAASALGLASFTMGAGVSGVRAAKQLARDKAAAREVKKGKNVSMLDTSKSTAAKQDYRIKQVKSMIGLCLNADTPEKVTSAINYLKASGVHTNKLFSYNGNPQKQSVMMYEALAKREFLE